MHACVHVTHCACMLDCSSRHHVKSDSVEKQNTQGDQLVKLHQLWLQSVQQAVEEN